MMFEPRIEDGKPWNVIVVEAFVTVTGTVGDVLPV
jgi:hypothetical protein